MNIPISAHIITVMFNAGGWINTHSRRITRQTIVLWLLAFHPTINLVIQTVTVIGRC